MKYFSTRNNNQSYSFKDAVLHGLAPDGGLFVPENIHNLNLDFKKISTNYDIKEIALNISKNFIAEEIPEDQLINIIEKTLSFPSPLVRLTAQVQIQELFHGPTLAFKDFGACFMANVMDYFVRNSDRELNILVATSGDTGSAVASGFLGIPRINVFILYPNGKVSEVQEKQFTTLGNNITALRIDGTFDDCQNLVKEAFQDSLLKSKINLSSANSINIARLIPQTFYYFDGFLQTRQNHKVVFSVPSGNLGNLTAGVIAKKMGLPVKKFVAATNRNNVFTEYLISGRYQSKKSVQTFSNAMDVGKPSNLERLGWIYGNDIFKFRNDIASFSFSDSETVRAIQLVQDSHNYILDPHGAIGYLALAKYQQSLADSHTGVILETAHYSKFLEVIKLALPQNKLSLHERLSKCLNTESKFVPLSNEYAELKEYLLNF